MVEERCAQRGIVVTYETVRQWCLKFGQTYANELRGRHPRCGDKWYMDEVVLTIGGKQHYLWRAVDQDGNVLDILVQSRRNTKAAKRFFRKLLKGLTYVPRVIITDKLKRYAAAKRDILPGMEQRQHKRLNNRAEHSHQPTRLREKNMRRFHPHNRPNACFLLIAPLAGHFQPRRHRMSAQDSHATLQNRFQTWNEGTGIKQAIYITNRSQHLMVPNIFLPSTSTLCFAPMNKLTIPPNQCD